MENDPIEKAKELEIARKAFSGNIQNLKRFQFTDNNNLYKQIKYVYPETTHIIIVNNDVRDGLGTPQINCRQISRQLHTSYLWSGKRCVNSVNWEQPNIVLAVVENNTVALKKITRSQETY